MVGQTHPTPKNKVLTENRAVVLTDLRILTLQKKDRPHSKIVGDLRGWDPSRCPLQYLNRRGVWPIEIESSPTQ